MSIICCIWNLGSILVLKIDLLGKHVLNSTHVSLPILTDDLIEVEATT